MLLGWGGPTLLLLLFHRLFHSDSSLSMGWRGVWRGPSANEDEKNSTTSSSASCYYSSIAAVVTTAAVLYNNNNKQQPCRISNRSSFSYRTSVALPRCMSASLGTDSSTHSHARLRQQHSHADWFRDARGGSAVSAVVVICSDRFVPTIRDCRTVTCT